MWAAVVCLAVVVASVSGVGYSVDFINRTVVTQVFNEMNGHLNTDGSSACARSDHLFYNHVMPRQSQRGLVMRMDNKNATCVPGAQISTGHLAANNSYALGHYEVHARVAHSESGNDAPHNAFTCFSSYTGEVQHNEIALCWQAASPSTIHFSYWVGKDKDGDKMHRVEIELPFNCAHDYHTYGWSSGKTTVTLYIDGHEKHQFDCGSKCPWEPMSMRLILRPDNTHYEGTALVDVLHASYTPP